jgi:uncharacterized membrane protein
MNLLLGAFINGVVLIVVGIIVSFFISIIHDSNLPDVCKEWNKNNIMEISLFLIGFIVHILYDKFNIYKKYFI